MKTNQKKETKMKKYKYAIYHLNKRLNMLEKRYNKYLKYNRFYSLLDGITKERAELTRAVETLKMFSR